MVSRRVPLLSHYAVAVLASLLAFLLTVWLRELLEPIIFPLFFGAVAVTAWYGGLGPSLVSTAMSALLSDYFLLPPTHSINLSLGILLRISVFVMVALLISSMTEARRRAEAGWQRSELKFRTIADFTWDWEFWMTPDRQFAYVSPSCERICGYLPSVFYASSTSFLDVVYPEDAGAVEAEVERAFARQTEKGMDFRILNKDGLVRWVSLAFQPIYGPDQTFLGVRGSIRDITDRKAIEEDRDRLLITTRSAQARAEAAVRMRDRFLSIASHELKTPLTVINGYAEILLRDKPFLSGLTKAQRQALEIIHRQADELHRLMDALLDFSTIEAGQLAINREPVDLAGLVRDLEADARPMLGERWLVIDAPDEPLLVLGDPLRLREILRNLLNNAIKYSPEQGRISIRVAARGEQVRIAVSDQGIGIPREALSQLFVPFFRASTTATRRIPGLGLGLYVVKEIASLHGGTVEVESAEGQGSTFSIILPRLANEPSQEVYPLGT